MDTLRKRITLPFLLLELGLYAAILLAGRGHYPAIVLCFLFALVQTPKSLITAGLFCTVLADLCLVVMDPIQRLWGMVFFLGAQILYAIRLSRGKTLLYLRLGLILMAETVTVLVLGKNTDALALVSLTRSTSPQALPFARPQRSCGIPVISWLRLRRSRLPSTSI